MPVTSAPTSAYSKSKGSDGKYLVTLVPGDGIGPEVAEAVKEIYRAANVPIKWHEVSVAPYINDQGKSVIPPEAVKSIKENTIALKGEFREKEYMKVYIMNGTDDIR